jgi:hypothetical protein
MSSKLPRLVGSPVTLPSISLTLWWAPILGPRFALNGTVRMTSWPFITSTAVAPDWWSSMTDIIRTFSGHPFPARTAPTDDYAHARVRVCGQETWYHNVTKVTADARGYLTLDLAAHPSRVHVWLKGSGTSVMLAASGPDVTGMLREEAGW